MPMISILEDEIYAFIKSKRYVSWVELQEAFPEHFKGDKLVTFDRLKEYNIYLWKGASDEFVNALNNLIKKKKIRVIPTHWLTYVIDGAVWKLPIAKRLVRYKKPRWLPVVFDIREGRTL